MPRKHRLTHSDFADLRGVTRYQGTLFSLVVGTIPRRKYAGSACVVSSKIARRAVDRYRVRRRVRALITPLMTHIPEGAVLIWYAKKPSIKATFDDLKRDIHSLAAKAGIHV